VPLQIIFNKQYIDIKQMRTRFKFLVQPESMRSIIDANQRGQRHSLLNCGAFLIRTRCK